MSCVYKSKGKMKPRFSIMLLVFAFSLTSCEIRTIDYATGDVKLISKTKTTVSGKPAIRLVIRNTGEKDLFDIIVTVKAKRRQIDLEIETLVLESLQANESVARVVVFRHLEGHDDYDLLTYAVSCTR